MSASVFGPSENRCRAGGRSKAIPPRVRSIRVRRFLTFKLCSAPRESEAGGRSEKFLEKKRRSRFGYVAGTNQGTRVPRHQTFSVKIPATDSPAFPMWGSRRALPVCEDASVVQNDGISQDGMTCTVIPPVLRACCTVVAHDCADWERSSNQRIILHAPA